MPATEHLYRVTLSVPKDQADAFATAIEPHCDSVSWSARPETSFVQVTGFAEGPPDRERVEIAVKATAEAMETQVPDIDHARIPVVDWVVENLKEFPPLDAGRFIIHGAEFEENILHGRISLEVPAGAAFGSGQHGSTMGCLLALDGLNSARPRHALDMGCGSGILALAIAKRWRIPVAAVDIDAKAVATAKDNVRVNGEGGLVFCGTGRGYRHSLVYARQFDLIMANILARPLTRMAKDLVRHLAPGGTAILAGLLTQDEMKVFSAHRVQGLHLKQRIRVDGWTTLVIGKRA